MDMEKVMERLEQMVARQKADMEECRRKEKEEMEECRRKEKEEMEECRRKEKEEMEANRRKDREYFLVKLEFSQEKTNIMLATLYADRKTDKDDMLKEMKAIQENRKSDKEDLKAKLDANQEKAAADKEELKAAMQYMRTELDDKIQHRIENILAIVETDSSGRK
ncbi:hypothetical protein B7P43_G16463 [Cryptotermes secundus]|uniref:Uncharacterized protein n=1 Tax=Cryptotermes secundus TaxID=105785 RepID=A0A2J7PMH0_9NEOP|nr:hypothetical protein B7P43_G16463 [Cryptotermes secundus]